jgi:hypothetical protein
LALETVSESRASPEPPFHNSNPACTDTKYQDGDSQPWAIMYCMNG